MVNMVNMVNVGTPAEVTEAEWSEFDLEKALWSISATRMKARREHVIPLPPQAVKMLRTLYALTGVIGSISFRSRRCFSGECVWPSPLQHCDL